MAKVTVRKETGRLVIDFTFRGVRCREQTALDDSHGNRKRVQTVIDKIIKSQKEGSFVYKEFFPESALASRFETNTSPNRGDVLAAVLNPSPLFIDFANNWFDEHCIQWRRSHIKALKSTLNGHLIPNFGTKGVGSITKSDVLQFRATLAKVKGRGTKEGLSAKRINEIMGLLRQIINEAADQYEFKHPMGTIKKLKQHKVDVNPFSLQDVQRILATVRPDYRNYMVTRIFTGMRTGEVNGLKWKYVDFELRLIRVRETFVLGEDEYTKTDGSQRDIQMSAPVMEALKAQWEATGKFSEYVFCNIEGKPLDNKNFTDRVWYPLLRHLGMEPRRPYQTRHTAATLWLASGEAPEWIARQLGHTDTQMLFKVYSRFVPNLTRQDGSAMERLLAAKLSHGPLATVEEDGGAVMIPVDPLHSDAMRQPIPRPGNWKKSDVHWSKEEAEQAQAFEKTKADTKETVVAKQENSLSGPKTSTDAKTVEQAEPLSWANLSRNWQETEFLRNASAPEA